MARVLVATALTFSAACGAQTADPPGPAPTTTVAPPDPHPPSTTTTTVPPSTQAEPPAPAGRTPAPRAPAAPATAAPTTDPPPSGGAAGSDFWRELANCECASGHCAGGHVGFFQFSPDTAAKVGIDGSEPYEEQRAAAEEWARRIHPREATSAGWPHCWGVALAKAAA